MADMMYISIVVTQIFFTYLFFLSGIPKEDDGDSSHQ